MLKLFYSIIFVLLLTNSSLAYSNTYNSPKPFDNLFSFSIDDLKLGPGIKKDELLEAEQGGVKFFDDFGKLVGFEWCKIPTTYQKIPEQELFQMVANTTYGTLKGALPQISIIKTEPIYRNSTIMLEILFNCPKGSTLMNAETRERFDSTRGVLLFRKGDWFYTLTVMCLDDPQASSKVKKELDRIVDLIKINS